MAKLLDKITTKALSIKENSSQIITLVIDDDLTIDYDLKDGKYQILIFNNANKAIKIKEQGQINNAQVEINYLDLNNYDLIQNNHLEVLANSSLVINSTYLGCQNKEINFQLCNAGSDSTINIVNNVVCLNEANFLLKVSGKILKGSKRAKCYQKSRCLTFENPKLAKILPILEIDENDVEASHSCSSGTIDQDVMYYMNSRGLNASAALALLLQSYLMPSAEFYQNYEAGLEIKNMAEQKVEKICSM